MHLILTLGVAPLAQDDPVVERFEKLLEARHAVCQQVAPETLQRVVTAQTPPAEELDGFAELVAKLPTARMFENAYKGEACLTVATVDSILKMQPQTGLELETVFCEDVLYAMKANLRMADAVCKPHGEMLKVARLLKEELQGYPLFSKKLFSDPERIGPTVTELKARIAVTCAGLAILKHRLKTGSLPRTLDDLRDLPKDPFTGTSLKFDGRCISSSGRCGEYDIKFRLD